MTPSTVPTRDPLPKHVCAVCGVVIPENKLYFCEAHWAQVPKPERVALMNLQTRRQNMDSKVCAIVRGIVKGTTQ